MRFGSFFKDSSYSMLARVWMALSRGLVIVVVSRVLGPELYGVYAVVLNTYVVMVMVGSLGLEQAHTYYSGRDPQRLRDLFANATILSFGLGGATILVFVGILQACRGWLFDDAAMRLLWRSLVFVPFAIFHNQLAGIVVGRARFGYYALSEAGKWGFYLLATLGLALAGRLTVGSALVVFYVAVGVTGLVHAVVVHRMTADQAASSVPRRRDLARAVLGYGWRAFSANLVNLLNFRFDLYLVQYFRTRAEVGHYSLGVNLAEVLLYFARSINLVLFSRISANVQRASTLTPTVARHVLTVVFGMVLAMVLFKDPVILRVFGANFAPSGNVVSLMLPGILAQTLVLLLIADLLGKGELRQVLASGILCFVVMTGLDLLLVPAGGIYAAASVSSFAYLVQAAYLLRHHARSHVQTITGYLWLRSEEWTRYLAPLRRRWGRA